MLHCTMYFAFEDTLLNNYGYKDLKNIWLSMKMGGKISLHTLGVMIRTLKSVENVEFCGNIAFDFENAAWIWGQSYLHH